MEKTLYELKREGIEQGIENAAVDWKSYAMECVIAVARRKELFTVNDVRDLVKHSPFQTHDRRAMGGVMKYSQRMGFIEPSGGEIVNKTGHGTKIQIWKSLIYGREAVDRNQSSLLI